jgi:hypothetical protein
MKGRPLALLLLVYLALDLGNPFMPGAVHFVNGHLEVVDVGRPPGNDVPMPAVVVGAAPPWTGPVPSRILSRVAAVGDHPRPWMPARRSFSSAAEPAPSSDDH